MSDYDKEQLLRAVESMVTGANVHHVRQVAMQLVSADYLAQHASGSRLRREYEARCGELVLELRRLVTAYAEEEWRKHNG